MASNYLVWRQDIVDGAATLSPMTGYPEDWKLLNGLPVTGELPSASQFAMDPDNPTGIALTDALYNRDMLIVGSERLRSVIEAEAGPDMEYLPVAVYNHQKRQIPEAYAIIHPLNPVDCLDIDACQVRWGRIDKNDIARLKQLVIDESRIDESRVLFRPKHYKSIILVHRKLAEKIDAAGCTGARWLELQDFPED